MARSWVTPRASTGLGCEAPGRKAFLFDANRCTGYQACEIACTIENELEGMSWRQVTTFNSQRHPAAPVIHLSQACNHCADPPCAEHCPALAYAVDPATGRVTLQEELCIGCSKCVKACEVFGNASFYLQVRHDVCVNCNDCSIARHCPSGAFKRVPADDPYILKHNNEELN